MSWDHVGSLGTITLALVPNGLSPADVGDCQAAIKGAADLFAGLVDGQGYRLPFKPGKKGYPWGSSSSVLNNGIVVALAYDLTGDPKYLAAAVAAMDYLLGRNPLDQSYVSGYGERPLVHPHHRFWAQQANAKFPPPPPGVLSGGPNSGLQDPYGAGGGPAGLPARKVLRRPLRSLLGQ